MVHHRRAAAAIVTLCVRAPLAAEAAAGGRNGDDGAWARRAGFQPGQLSALRPCDILRKAFRTRGDDAGGGPMGLLRQTSRAAV